VNLVDEITRVHFKLFTSVSVTSETHKNCFNLIIFPPKRRRFRTTSFNLQQWRS